MIHHYPAKLALGTILLAASLHLTGCASETAGPTKKVEVTTNQGEKIELPRVISSEKFIFPSGLREKPANAKVEITAQFMVNESGGVEDVKVISSTDSFYNPLVTDALKKWRFTPATKNGVPFKLPMVLPVVFEVKG